MTSSFDEYDYDLIAENCTPEDPYNKPYITKSKLFWTSIRVMSKYSRHIHNFSKKIEEDKIIDEYGNLWDPHDHPRQNNAIPYKPYGVAINTERVAKVERLEPQNTLVVHLSYIFCPIKRCTLSVQK